jgi:carbon monoxide dehydrogenase subunit G
MAKFPTESERSITAKAPIAKVYRYFWDVPGHAPCIPGLDTCKKVSTNTYRFVYEPRSTGPVSITARYTARYKGNGKDEINYQGAAGKDDNTDMDGTIRLEPAGRNEGDAIRQTIAPETPVPKPFRGSCGDSQKEAWR